MPLVLVAFLVSLAGSLSLLSRYVYPGIRRADKRMPYDFDNLYEHYSHRHYRWVMLVICKETLFAITGALFPGDQYTQTLWGCAVVWSYAAAVILKEAYRAPWVGLFDATLHLHMGALIRVASLSLLNRGILDPDEERRRSEWLLALQILGWPCARGLA